MNGAPIQWNPERVPASTEGFAGGQATAVIQDSVFRG